MKFSGPLPAKRVLLRVTELPALKAPPPARRAWLRAMVLLRRLTTPALLNRPPPRWTAELPLTVVPVRSAVIAPPAESMATPPPQLMALLALTVLPASETATGPVLARA